MPQTKEPKDVNDPQGPINDAARKKDWPEVFRLIDREGGRLDVKLAYNNKSLMHYAAEQGNFKMMRTLHGRGLPFEGLEDKNGTDVVHVLAENGYVEMIEWLRQQGADIKKAGGSSKRNILQIGVSGTNLVLTEYALDVGLNPNQEDQYGNTPLTTISSRSLSDKVKGMMSLLLDRGAQLDFVNKSGECALHKAAYEPEGMKMVEFLLDAGADIETPGAKYSLDDVTEDREEYWEFGMYPIKMQPMRDLIEARRNMPTIDLAGDFEKEDLFKQDAYGYTPLDNRETLKNLRDIADVLAEKGTPLERDDLLRSNKDDKTFLQRAIECRTLQPMLEVMADRGQWLEPLDFVAEDGKSLSDIGKAALLHGSIRREVFQREMWNGRHPQELQNFYNQMPKPLQRQVNNLNQLKATLSSQQREMAR